MSALIDRHRVKADTPEALWSPVLQATPMLSLEQLVPAQARLVVVVPHPEDEVLACGGLLAAHIFRGGRAAVITVTDGESIRQANQPPSGGGLRSLGVTVDELVRLKMPDGTVSRYVAPLRESLEALLRDDDVIVTTWHLDGHPDHDAVGAATQSLCTDICALCLQVPLSMWHWSHPGDTQVPWQRLRGFSLDAEMVERKRLALATHAAQWVPLDEYFYVDAREGRPGCRR